MIPVKRHGRGILRENNPVQIKAPKQELRRKRFYKTVAVTDNGGNFSVTLDGRALHTPGRAKLETVSKPLADAVAAEWEAQAEFIDPATMPLTKLLNTSVDRIAPNQVGIIHELLSFFDTDLLCYRATGPAALVERQAVVWQPVLEWLVITHDVKLSVGSGLMPLSQPPEVRPKMDQVLSGLGPIALTGVQATASMTGSLSLALALVVGNLSGAEAVAAAFLDETWQMENWGADQEALARRARLEAEILAVERFLLLHD